MPESGEAQVDNSIRGRFSKVFKGIQNLGQPKVMTEKEILQRQIDEAENKRVSKLREESELRSQKIREEGEAKGAEAMAKSQALGESILNEWNARMRQREQEQVQSLREKLDKLNTENAKK